jgi:hypothetical protein
VARTYIGEISQVCQCGIGVECGHLIIIAELRDKAMPDQQLVGAL